MSTITQLSETELDAVTGGILNGGVGGNGGAGGNGGVAVAGNIVIGAIVGHSGIGAGVQVANANGGAGGDGGNGGNVILSFGSSHHH